MVEEVFFSVMGWLSIIIYQTKIYLYKYIEVDEEYFSKYIIFHR